MPDWLTEQLPIATTFSKDPRFFAQGFEPNALSHGTGAHAYSGYGVYLDWISALGANLLGYGHRGYQERLSRQIGNGVAFSLPHFLEGEVAAKLVNLLGTHVPGWAPDGLGVRFGLSGSDACSMAIRLARAVTGRRRVLSSGYHGFHDAFVSTTPPAWGVTQPQYVEDFSFDDLETLGGQMAEPDIAAIIFEHPMNDPAPDYYASLRQLCDAHGCLLIADEVVTGLRYGLGGACERYGITPDLVVMGKALGNGIPTSCIVGRREYFDWFARADPVFISSTHFGNAVSLAAADAVLDMWHQEGVDHLWTIGRALMDGLTGQGYEVIGHAPRLLIQFPSLAHKTYFTLGMRDRGILWNRPTLPNLAHTQADVELTLEAAREIKAEIELVDVENLMADKLPMVLFEGR